MIERKLSEVSESVAPTELDPVSQPPLEPVVVHSQQLDLEPQPTSPSFWQDSQIDHPPKFESPSPTRPVARPLRADIPKVPNQADKTIILLEDDEPSTDNSASEAAARARRIAHLKAKIQELEAMKGKLEEDEFYSAWGGLVFKFLTRADHTSYHVSKAIIENAAYMHRCYVLGLDWSTYAQATCKAKSSTVSFSKLVLYSPLQKRFQKTWN